MNPSSAGWSAARTDVAVIIPVYNAERYLGETLESVLAQTWDRWHVVIIDDGSTDASGDVARRYVERHGTSRFTLVRHEGGINRGLPFSRLLGRESSDSPYVALLDADDVWLPDKLERQLRVLDAHPEVGLVASPAIYWSSWEGGVDRTVRFETRPGLHPPDSLVGRLYPFGRDEAPCPSTLLFRRSMLERIPGHEEAFSRSVYEDQAMLLGAYTATSVYLMAEATCRYRVRDASMCHDVTPEQYSAARRHFLDWAERTLAPGSATLRRALRRERTRRRFGRVVTLDRWLRRGLRSALRAGTG